MTERLAYEPLRRDGAFELRRYRDHLAAQVRVRASGPSAATNVGFGPLAAYIFGDNHSADRIEMTTPVTAEPDRGRRIEMTVPVTAEASSDADEYVVSFVMPSRFSSVEDLPRPDDSGVALVEVPGYTAAVMGFGGYLTDAAYRRAVRELSEWVTRNGWSIVGAPIAAQFDGPWKPPFARHNEVIIPVSGVDGAERVVQVDDTDQAPSRHPIEHVSDYPRPPSIMREDLHVRAVVGGRVLAETQRPIVIRETTHPPVFYFPPEAVDMTLLEPSPHVTHCEYKGEAHYYTVVLPDRRVANAGWYYPRPNPGYEAMTDHVAFYAWALDEATVDGERVSPQEGHFYGGWVVSWVKGPFKGGAGTAGR